MILNRTPQTTGDGGAETTVLIVDDDSFALELLSAFISEIPACKAVPFTAAAPALDWCREGQTDLAIVDYRLPHTNGLEFLKAFRRLPGKRDIPFVIVTGANEKDSRVQALEAGVSDFLTKPLDREEFLARTRNLLLLRRHQKELAKRADLLAEEVRRKTAAIAAREHETIFRLSLAAEYRDEGTGAHLVRISGYCRLIARELGLSTLEQEMLAVTSPMHDLGKVGIPDHILLKPGRLNAEEFAVMQTHPSIGHRILADSQSHYLQAAAVIAFSHHEKFDGTGYPGGLAGEAIPLTGRIVAVADVFDALLSDRPYKTAFVPRQARNYLQEESGSHFDPDCIKAFLAAWEEILALREDVSRIPLPESALDILPPVPT